MVILGVFDKILHRRVGNDCKRTPPVVGIRDHSLLTFKNFSGSPLNPIIITDPLHSAIVCYFDNHTYMHHTDAKLRREVVLVFLRFIEKRCKNPDRNITSCFVVIVVKNDNHNVPI